MKITFLSFILYLFLIIGINAQCNTYVQMVSGPEGCVVPVIVSTQQALLPCSAPSGFNELQEGDFAFIEYTASGCINICQFGLEVDITCFSLPVGIHKLAPAEEIEVFPTLVHSIVYIEGNDIMMIEIYNGNGIQMMKNIQPDVLSIDLVELDAGIYFMRIISKNQILVKKIVKY